MPALFTTPAVVCRTSSIPEARLAPRDSIELAQLASNRALDLLRQGKREAAADAFDGLALLLRDRRPTKRLHPRR